MNEPTKTRSLLGRTIVPSLTLGLSLLAAAALPLFGCDKDKPSASPEVQPGPPTLRIYALSGAAGAIEPCGCVKDMLGGIDHAAAFIAKEKKQAPHALVLGAGPMFFENPHIETEKKEQQLYKAEAMAQSLSDLGLHAWTPGANDWANGPETFARLSGQTGAKVLGANLEGIENVIATTVIERGPLKVGLIGISVPKGPTGQTPVAAKNPKQAIEKGLSQLTGTEINIALIAAPRGEALRLVESINQGEHPLQLAILGKPFDQGENNDEPFSPEVIDNTLVVQAPNHLQAISVIDLYVRDGNVQFVDGTGLRRFEEKVSLQGRIEELARRIERWKAPGSKVDPKEIASKEKERARLETQLKQLEPTSPPKRGSYFLYDLVFVKEALGEDPRVSSRMNAYYKRVNEHNRVAFADRKPPALPPGQASYIGVQACSNCHLEERAFWDKTAHAHAYSTLEVAHKEFNLDCVSCHVTGYEQPGGSTVTFVDDFKSVQCEVCHGPGSNHAENPGAPGAIERSPSRTLCASACHHPPHVGADWSVDVAWPQIIGEGHGM